MDYEIITVSKYDGKGGKEKAVEVFNCATGKAIAIVRRNAFESKDAWIARAKAIAFERAEAEAA